jgi:putative ABC transport system permease protein
VQALVSDELMRDIYSANSLNNWFNVLTDTYVKTNSAADIVALRSGMEPMMQRALGENYKEGHYYFEPYALEDLHFHRGENPGGILVTNPTMLYILLALGLLILVLGATNFTIMAIGKAVVRAKEVGVRKTMGAAKGQLTFQFMFESMMVTFMSFVLALLVAHLLLPQFNTLFETNLSIDFSWKQLLLMVLLLMVLTGMAGGFPSFYLAGMRAIQVLKGNYTANFGKVLTGCGIPFRHPQGIQIIFRFFFSHFSDS